MGSQNNSDRKYVGAPYNFVPFSNKVYAPVMKDQLEIHDRIDESLKTGEITFTIEAKTPIIIDNGKGEFFKNENGKEVIPGSSLRGLLRNNVQILSSSSFDGDIDDYNLMYRNVASGALKKEYSDILGNAPVSFNTEKGSVSISVLKNVKAGYIKCEGGKYYIYPTLIDEISDKMPNYYVLSERKIVNNYINHRSNFAYGFFVNGNQTIMQNMHNKPFKKSEDKNGRMHYKGTENPEYKPYIKECSYESRGKDIIKVENVGVCSNKGWVLSSGIMREKKAVYIIPEKNESNEYRILIPDADIKAYKIDYKKKEKALITLCKKDEKVAEEFYGLPKDGEEKPVFYINEDGRLYFGFTPRLRLFYKNPIKEGYKHQIEGKKDGFDLATSLFGISDKNNNSYKSKVSVADAVLSKGVSGKENTVVLAEPKPSSYLDYLVQENGEYITYSSEEFKLRGVKQYWLRDSIYNGNRNMNNDKVGTTFKPLDAGAKFSATVRFQNLTSKELGLLLWAIRLEDGSEMNIGKGKPYGYGRIKISDFSAKVIDVEKAYSLDALVMNPFVSVNISELIEQYKETMIGGKRVDELSSVVQFLKMKNSEKLPNENDIRYMSIDDREYQSRDTRLGTIDEVLAGKMPDPIQKRKDNKGNYNKNNSSSSRNNQGKSKGSPYANTYSTKEVAKKLTILWYSKIKCSNKHLSYIAGIYDMKPNDIDVLVRDHVDFFDQYAGRIIVIDKNDKIEKQFNKEDLKTIKQMFYVDGNSIIEK